MQAQLTALHMHLTHQEAQQGSQAVALISASEAEHGICTTPPVSASEEEQGTQATPLVSECVKLTWLAALDPDLELSA